jgi:hypothetical protein
MDNLLFFHGYQSWNSFNTRVTLHKESAPGFNHSDLLEVQVTELTNCSVVPIAE